MSHKPRSDEYKIRTYLEFSNLRESPHSCTTSRWPGNEIAVAMTKPTPGRGEHALYYGLVEQGVAEINRALSGVLRLVLTTNRVIGKTRVIVSFGTAYIPPEETERFDRFSANVSRGKGLGHRPARGENGEINGPWLYMNLGHDGPGCMLTKQIVIHEFGHALGLGRHFPGFGCGRQIISNDFWDVLATLYGNDCGTSFPSLDIRRAS